MDFLISPLRLSSISTHVSTSIQLSHLSLMGKACHGLLLVLTLISAYVDNASVLNFSIPLKCLYSHY